MVCKLCGHQKLNLLLKVDPANFSSRISKFEIYRCDDCDFAQMSPFPESKDLEEIYLQENAWSGVRFDNRQPNFFYQMLENLYQRYGNYYRFVAKTCLSFVKNKKDPNILDLGCSSGLVLKAFYDLNPNINLTGVEIDPRARDLAFPEIRDRIQIGDFLKMKFEDPFDLISMNFLVEHLPNFEDFFIKSRDLLKPGGFLYFSTPDIDSSQARQLGQRWYLINRIDAKMGHLVWFNQKSIRYLAQKLRLEVVFMKNRGELIYDFKPIVQKFLRRILGTDSSGRRFIKYFPIRILYATLVDGLISERVSRGDSIYVIFQKPEDTPEAP